MAQEPETSLPRVVLKDKAVPFAVLSLIPLSTVEKYHVAAFESGATVLKLALVHPEALKQGFYASLKELGQKIGKNIELYQTDSASMQAILKQYKAGGKALSPATSAPVAAAVPTWPPPAKPEVKEESPPKPKAEPVKPPLFELGKTVSATYLKKIPYTFSTLHHVVCVDFLPPNTYWFVTDEEHHQGAESSLKFIEEENKVVAHLITVKTAELKDLLSHYEAVIESEKKEKEEKANRETQEKEKVPAQFPGSVPEKVEVPSEVGKDVVVPQAQGSILTAEEERPGIAGIFQKMAQSIATEKDRGKQADIEIPVVEEPVNQGPITASEVAPIASGSAPSIPIAPISATSKPHQSSEDESDLGKLISKTVETIDELKGLITKGFVPQIVAALVSFAIHEKASDIHVESYDDEVRVRYRIDGQLIDIVKLPPDVHAAMVSRVKILSRLRLDETRIPQDGRFDVNFQDAQVDLRISVMPTVHGEKVVMRILDKSKGITSLDSLGIQGLAFENLLSAVKRPYGICLATGPTGSGKSTSLYAILNRIATPDVNVVTLEDPVEYEMKGVNQSQIRPKIGYTFAEGLRSVLRQDPNIIMVGEIRDGETATMATQAALTGHLVLSTLHTNDASGAIPRLNNMGIEPFLITSSLNMVMGQRLVRRICPHCKTEISLPAGVRQRVEADIQRIAELSPKNADQVKVPTVFYQGAGCDQCKGKGYLGRLGIYEVLMMSDAIEELTLARSSATAIGEQAQKEGMLTMYQDGLLKVVSGITTLDEVLRETSNK